MVKFLGSNCCVECNSKENLRYIGYFGKYQKSIWICTKCDVWI